MCYPCTRCGRCGKFDKNSPYYTPLAPITCFACGGDVDAETGVCLACGAPAFPPPGQARTRRGDAVPTGDDLHAGGHAG